jgi:hypothetical protein
MGECQASVSRLFPTATQHVAGIYSERVIVDGVIKELVAQGYVSPEVNPQAFRSALMGAVEGMLRDHMLARTSRYPGTFTEADMRVVLAKILQLFMTK